MTTDIHDELNRERADKPKTATDKISREGWGLFPDITPEQYHLDPCPEASISNSGMTRLLNETPLDFAYNHPKLNPAARDDAKATAAMRRGDIVHQLALGKGKGYAIGDFADWRTKDARSFRDNAIADGQTPVKRSDFEEAEVMAGVIVERIREALDGADYQTEVVGMYQEQTAAGPIWVRFMMDVWSPELNVILDPKVTANLYDAKVERHLLNMGWDRQAALYTRAIGMIFPDRAGRVEFADLMIKPEAPFTSRLVSIDRAWLNSSVRQCQRAFDIFGACYYAGNWPGFPPTIDRVRIPHWEDKRREAEELGAA